MALDANLLAQQNNLTNKLGFRVLSFVGLERIEE